MYINSISHDGQLSAIAAIVCDVNSRCRTYKSSYTDAGVGDFTGVSIDTDLCATFLSVLPNARQAVASLRDCRWARSAEPKHRLTQISIIDLETGNTQPIREIDDVIWPIASTTDLTVFVRATRYENRSSGTSFDFGPPDTVVQTKPIVWKRDEGFPDGLFVDSAIRSPILSVDDHVLINTISSVFTVSGREQVALHDGVVAALRALSSGDPSNAEAIEGLAERFSNVEPLQGDIRHLRQAEVLKSNGQRVDGINIDPVAHALFDITNNRSLLIGVIDADGFVPWALVDHSIEGVTSSGKALVVSQRMKATED